jgi:hypothetical protein
MRLFEAESIQKLLHDKKIISCCDNDFSIYGRFIRLQLPIPSKSRFDISQGTRNQRHRRVFHVCFVFRCTIQTGNYLQINDANLWQTGWCQFLLTYITISYLHLHMVFISRSLFATKTLLDIRSVFNSRQSTDQEVDIIRVYKVSFTGSYPQMLRSLQRFRWHYHLPLGLMLHTVFISRSWFNIKRLLEIRSVCNSKQSTEQQVDITWASTVSFIGSYPQILRSLHL